MGQDSKVSPAYELARWMRILTANRLINVAWDPAVQDWRNTGKGGTTHGGADFCTPIEALADSLDLEFPMHHDPCPFFVELCAGTAAVSLALQGGRRARPPVSRMGSKRGYAHAILWACGLRSGQGAEHYLWCEPDPGVRLLLEAYRDPELAREAAAIIRGWKDEEPRALWERLRAEGPVKEPEPREVAREVLLHRWSFSGKGPEKGYGGPGCVVNAPTANWTTEQRDASMSPDRVANQVVERCPSLPSTIHPDARVVDPREVARWGLLGQWSYRRGHPESGLNHGLLKDREPTPTGGNAAKARTCEQEAGLWDGCPTVDATITPDARPIEPADLPPGTVVYIDPPYVGTTGYGHDLPREEVVAMARRWADAGALVCISEQEPIPALMADGWYAIDITVTRSGQKRTFSKQQREYLTLSRPPAWDPRDITNAHRMKVVDIKAALPDWTQAQLLSALREEHELGKQRKTVINALADAYLEV